MMDMQEYARMVAEQHKRLVEAGMQIGEQRVQKQIHVLAEAYKQAALDPATKIPTYLELAIYGLITLIPPGGSSSPRR